MREARWPVSLEDEMSDPSRAVAGNKGRCQPERRMHLPSLPRFAEGAHEAEKADKAQGGARNVEDACFALAVLAQVIGPELLKGA